MKIKFQFITTLLFLLFSIHSFSQNYYIHCGYLIDGINDKPEKEMTILVSGNKIIDVFKGYKNPEENATLIDLSQQYVMPGFIDMHVHLENEMTPDAYLKRFTDNPEDIAFQSTVYAKRTLLAGFTTVRDVGGSGVNIALRNAINKGIVVGPRIFTSGKSLAVTGGHADPTNGCSHALMGDPGPKEGVVNSHEDAKKAVRQRYKNGADLIKITATGGVLSVAKDGLGPHFQEDEIVSIVNAAKDLGFHVAAHAHGDEGMKRAIRAGVKTIEHGTFMSEETMELMKEHNTFLIPTLTAGFEVTEKSEIEGFYPEIVAKKATTIGPQIQRTLSLAYKKGVPIGFGTDAGVFPHGENAREFGYMVDGGIPPMKAIKFATSVNSEILGMEDQIGQIKQGNLADIVAVKSNPLADITVLEQVSFVMKEGVVYKGE